MKRLSSSLLTHLLNNSVQPMYSLLLSCLGCSYEAELSNQIQNSRTTPCISESHPLHRPSSTLTTTSLSSPLVHMQISCLRPSAITYLIDIPDVVSKLYFALSACMLLFSMVTKCRLCISVSLFLAVNARSRMDSRIYMIDGL